jgi:hypothetical protein
VREASKGLRSLQRPLRTCKVIVYGEHLHAVDLAHCSRGFYRFEVLSSMLIDSAEQAPNV